MYRGKSIYPLSDRLVTFVCMYSNWYIKIVKLQSGPFSFLTLRVFPTLFYALSPVRFSDVMNNLAAPVTFSKMVKSCEEKNQVK